MTIDDIKMIAFFDVLGFKDRVRKKGLQEVYAEYEQLIQMVVTKNGSLCIGRAIRGDGYYSPAVGWLAVDHAYFSDTVLLWSKFDQFRYPAFCSLSACLICEALSSGMPLRGAVSVGQAVLNKTTNVFLGPAIVEASDVEKAQSWIGVSFAPSAAKQLQGFDPRLVLPYARHRKDGTAHLVEGAVLDWPRYWRKNLPKDIITTLHSLDPHPYIENTINFVRFSEANHDWFLNRESFGISENG